MYNVARLTSVTVTVINLFKFQDKTFGVLYNSLRVLRLFSEISKIEGKYNNLQMATHLSTVQARTKPP